MPGMIVTGVSTLSRTPGAGESGYVSPTGQRNVADGPSAVAMNSDTGTSFLTVAGSIFRQPRSGMNRARSP
ncbi:MAG: hypothetical protein ACK4KW_09305 [Gemmobacter sp.]